MVEVEQVIHSVFTYSERVVNEYFVIKGCQARQNDF